MIGHFHDGRIFGVISWKFILAGVLVVAGVLLIRYGANESWLRLKRRLGGKKGEQGPT